MLSNVLCILYHTFMCMHTHLNMRVHLQVDAGSQLLLDNVERYATYLANALDDSEGRVVQGGNNLGMFAYVPVYQDHAWPHAVACTCICWYYSHCVRIFLKPVPRYTSVVKTYTYVVHLG